jgi:hypothetical protein
MALNSNIFLPDLPNQCYNVQLPLNFDFKILASSNLIWLVEKICTGYFSQVEKKVKCKKLALKRAS